jgi:hypothetical protein
MSTTITADHGKYFQHIFLQKRAINVKKNTKIRKGKTSRVKMRNQKNHRNLKIIFLKSCIVPSSVNCSLIT